MLLIQIYLIRNLVNTKLYVGKTLRTVKQRWSAHCSSAKCGEDSKFYRAIRKYGPESFEIEEVAAAATEDQADRLEQAWIAAFKTYDSELGYNSTYGGEGGLLTQEAKEKISTVRKTLFRDPDFKRRMSAANTGKHHTSEGRQNISSALKGNQYRVGIPHTEETKSRLRESLKRAYAEGRHRKTEGLKKGTKLGPMPDRQKRLRSEGVKRARQNRFWSTRKKVSFPV